MGYTVRCRICHKEINKKTMKEDIDWIMPTNRYYYHKSCYNDWKRQAEDIKYTLNEELYKKSMLDYLTKDLRMSPNYSKIMKQWDSLIKKGKTPKGIFISLKYYYEVMNGDTTKADGGIGIVPYIYDDAAKYWVDREKRETGILEKIERQIREKNNQATVIVYQNTPKKKKKKEVSLEDIELMDDMV